MEVCERVVAILDVNEHVRPGPESSVSKSMQSILRPSLTEQKLAPKLLHVPSITRERHAGLVCGMWQRFRPQFVAGTGMNVED